jgi:hypothetical protein
MAERSSHSLQRNIEPPPKSTAIRKILDQNSEKQGPKWKKQLKKQEKILKNKNPQLRGWSVSIMWIPRNVPQSKGELINWWIEYLQEGGAKIEDNFSLLSVDTITG